MQGFSGETQLLTAGKIVRKEMNDASITIIFTGSGKPVT